MNEDAHLEAAYEDRFYITDEVVDPFGIDPYWEYADEGDYYDDEDYDDVDEPDFDQDWGW